MRNVPLGLRGEADLTRIPLPLILFFTVAASYLFTLNLIVRGSGSPGQMLWYQRNQCLLSIIELWLCCAQFREFLRRRRARGRGTCPKCGYILLGLPENRCPECGRPFRYDEVGMSVDDQGLNALMESYDAAEPGRLPDAFRFRRGGPRRSWILAQSVAMIAVGLMILHSLWLRLWLVPRLLTPAELKAISSFSPWQYRVTDTAVRAVVAMLHFVIAYRILKEDHPWSDGSALPLTGPGTDETRGQRPQPPTGRG
jgi:hypothetical protein